MSDRSKITAVRVLREGASSLSSEIDAQTSRAIEGVEELVRLLDERRTLERAAVSLEGASRKSPPIEEREFSGIRDPLVRAERAVRELRSIQRQKEMEREPPQHVPTARQSKESRKSSGDAAERVDIVKEAAEFAMARAGVVPLHEFAAHILDLAPNRYRSIATAQASLYHHLGKSDRFFKSGPSMFRLINSGSGRSGSGGPADSPPHKSISEIVDPGDLPFE